MTQNGTTGELIEYYRQKQSYLLLFVTYPVHVLGVFMRTGFMRELKAVHREANVMEVANAFCDNMSYMHTICQIKNIHFISILQPFNSLGLRDLTEEDKVMLSEFNNAKLSSGKSHLIFIKEYYDAVIRQMRSQEYFHNGIFIFDREKGQIFADNMHISDNGQKIMAHFIFELIKKRREG